MIFIYNMAKIICVLVLLLQCNIIAAEYSSSIKEGSTSEQIISERDSDDSSTYNDYDETYDKNSLMNEDFAGVNDADEQTENENILPIAKIDIDSSSEIFINENKTRDENIDKSTSLEGESNIDVNEMDKVQTIPTNTSTKYIKGSSQNSSSSLRSIFENKDTSYFSRIMEERVLRLNSNEGKTKTNKTLSKKAMCLPTASDDFIEILNSTGLSNLVSPNINISTRSTASSCVLVFFYSNSCIFSKEAYPMVLATQRSLIGFIPIYAVPSKYTRFSVNSHYGIAGTPTLLLFHHGYAVSYYNESSYTPELLNKFLHHWTNYTEPFDISVKDEDHLVFGELEALPRGPLYASWTLLSMALFYFFSKTQVCTHMLENMRNNWREAEQHHHQD